jgi:serine/threonine protein kinase
MPTCARCHADTPDAARFCPYCGAALIATPPAPPAPDPFVGRTINGTYFIERRIGSGGMGVVYKAVHVKLDVPLAVKILRKPLSGDSAAVERFEREARAASRLRHPNVIHVTDFGEADDGTLYMVSEYVAGKSLARVIADEFPLPERRVVKIAEQILSALAEAHANGVLHRDLKPENVMLEARRQDVDHVKIVDFGIAEIGPSPPDAATGEPIAGASASPPLVIGTPGYMSPEQWTGERLDARSDLYSVGVLLYEMLTGALPVEPSVTPEVVREQLLRDPVPPSAHRAVSPDLEAVVLRALARDRDRRPGGAEEMRTALLACEGLLASETAAPGARAAVSARHTGTANDTLVPAPRTVTASPLPRAAETQRPRPARRETRPAARIALVSAVAISLAVGAALGLVANDLRPLPSFQVSGALFLGSLVAVAALAALATLAATRSRTAAVAVPMPPPRPAPPPAPPPEPPARAETVLLPAVPSGSVPRAAVGDVGLATLVMPSLGPQEPGAREAEQPALVITECSERYLVGKTTHVDHVPFTIGRSSDADLAIPGDPQLSRAHAIVDFREGAYWVRDAGSGNGVFVNGRRVAGLEPLVLGAELRLSAFTCIAFTYGGPAALPDLTGRVIDGRYELLRPLRSSVKAAVYAAADKKVLPREIAVKILSPRMAAFPGSLAQFELEATVAAGLDHPFICAVSDHGVADVELGEGRTESVRYLCSRMMPGGNLADRLGPTGARIPLAHAGAWIGRLAEALEYAHRKGVVHSGLKPTSVVFDAQENPYVTDFATAYRGPGAGPRAIVGAPAFLAPEQWDDRDPTPAVDQFALAALAYVVITGRHPHDGQENPEVRRRNFERGPIDAHQEAAANGRGGVPAAVSHVLRRALSVEPQARYPSVGDFARAFQDAVAGRSAVGPAIFFSYHRERSAGWANLFATELEAKHGLEVYVDTRNREGAGPFPERLRKAIESCDVFVCFLADGSLRSAWVTEEIRIAHEARKPLIPVYQESFDEAASAGLSPHVDGLLRCDGLHLFDERSVHVEHTIEELAAMVKKTVAAAPGAARVVR